jgi:heme exporter protein A
VQGEAVIEARGLTKRYGAIAALDSIDLDVRRGESVAVFGPNGAGKTTLVRILTRSLRPTAGTVRIGGTDLLEGPHAIRGAIGVISHQTFLYDDLSARENLVFYARLYGVLNPDKRADRLLESMGLAERADDPVRTFSRGMQQRLALARALVHEPDLLFLDEPFTGLDPYAGAMFRSILKELRGRGTTILLVTHNLGEGLKLADRWLILRRGTLALHGSSAGIDRLEFERTYLEQVAPRTKGAPA